MQARLNLVMQMLSVEQVMHADADTIDLVSVSRTDTTAGGADLMFAEEAFSHLVEYTMIRRDDVCAFAHQQSGAVHAAAFKAVDLLEQYFGIDHDTVADDRGRRRTDDAGWQQVQCVRFVSDHHGMACIVAAVEACNVIDFGTDEIGGLAFTLVAPLSANQHDTRHNAPPRCRLIPPKTAYLEPSTAGRQSCLSDSGESAMHARLFTSHLSDSGESDIQAHAEACYLADSPESDKRNPGITATHDPVRRHPPQALHLTQLLDSHELVPLLLQIVDNPRQRLHVL